MECPQCKNPLSVENASVCEWCGNQLPIPEESFFSKFKRLISILINKLKTNKKRIIFVAVLIGTLFFVFYNYLYTNDTSAELGEKIVPETWEEQRAFKYLTDSVKNSKEDFEILARKYSQDTLLSSYQGRSVNNGDLPPEFDKMAAKLEVNEVSEIFEIRDVNSGDLIQYAIMKVLQKQNGFFYKVQYITRNIKLEIGQYYLGGIIVELDYNAEHGLIAAKKDLDQYDWFDAKQKCEELELNGYDDWQLPNKDELDILYKSKDIVGGFASNYYWSSTESDFYYACCNNFFNGNAEYNTSKFIRTYHVRAVRAF
jgi:hypothetical protein